MIELETEAEASGLGEEAFRALAEKTKNNCPVSKALAAVEVKLKARLKSGG
jgi:osmotically inducible protein OsmC